MKRIITLLMLLPLSLLAQENNTEFTGIGKFKIGIDTATFLEQMKDLGRTEYKTFMDAYHPKKGTFSELKRNGKELIDYEIHDASPDENIFLISELNISGIVIKKVYLKFYKNYLYEFKSDMEPKLEEAMVMKYPKHISKIKSDTTYCIYNATGNKVPLVGLTSTKSWSTKSITASSVFSAYYDDKCEKKYLSYFYYYDNDIKNRVSEQRILFKKEKKQKEEDDKKNKLKDF